MSPSGSSSELSLLVGQKQCPQEPVGRVGGGDGPLGDEAVALASFRGLVLDAGSSKPQVTVGSMWKPPSPRKHSFNCFYLQINFFFSEGNIGKPFTNFHSGWFSPPTQQEMLL